MRSSVSGVRQLPKLQLQQVKVDRLGENLSGAQPCGAAPAIVVAVGGYHQHRQRRVAPSDPAGPARPSRHVNVREEGNQCRLDAADEFAQPILAELAKCTRYVPCPVTLRVPSLGVAGGS